MSLSVYTYNFSLTVPHLGNAIEIFRLTDNQRELEIRSIMLQTKITTVVAGAFHYYSDFNLPDTIHYRLMVGDGLMLSNKIGKTLDHVGGTGVVIDTGDYFSIEQNGIYHFSSFFITESIDFAFSSDNSDPAIDAFFWASCVIEVSSSINF